MKNYNYLTLLMITGITLTAQAQIVDNYQPDSDGDGCIGSADLITFLSVYGTCGAFDFNCGNPISFEGYNYTTVQIGEQCWFAENLRTGNYSNGDSIPSGLSFDSWSSASSGASSVFGEGEDNCFSNTLEDVACDELYSSAEYGRLYNFHAIIDERGLCPQGWHVPNDAEWTETIDFLGGFETAGAAMKSSSGWFGNFNGTNSSGFNAVPGGARYQNGFFYDAGAMGYWWTSTASDSDGIYKRMDYSNDAVSTFDASFGSGLSVRCIQD